MPRLRWLSFQVALLACALLGAALVVAPALLAVLAMLPAADFERVQRLLVLQRGEGGGLLFLAALAVIAISYLPALARFAEGGRD